MGVMVMAKLSYKISVTQYLYNRTTQIEEDYLSKIAYNRFHNTDEVDWLEIIIAKARKDLINEISKDLNNLLAFPDKR